LTGARDRVCGPQTSVFHVCVLDRFPDVDDNPPALPPVPVLSRFFFFLTNVYW
jgi:hypothetical protein